ncbi:helix-turn-helix domain-containing protein [Streptomyces sp. NPDC005955]|uniref:helix-turn-helix domain-containing protein n=1 Tax=Streptomyces sp. NPDC005955 TaxID=3364738 RepID=UPI00369F011E
MPSTADPAGPQDEPIAFGQRLRMLRMRRGLSRPQLGGLTGYSAEWVKKLESGQRSVPRLPVVLRLAEVLRVRDLTELTGDQHSCLPLFAGAGHARLGEVKAAVDAYPLSTQHQAPPVDHLASRVTRAWTARHSSPHHREVIGALLPGLILDAQLAVRQADRADQRRAGQAVLSEVYSLAQFFVAYQPDAALLWRVAERALIAAQESEDPHAIGVAAWLATQAHRDGGPAHFDAADAINRGTLAFLEPLLPDAPDTVLAITGALTFEVGYTAACRGETGTAWRYWDTARAMADRLPWDYYHPITSFSRAVMGAHAVTVAVELRAGNESVRHAAATDTSAIASRPRRARHWIEAARGYHLDGQPDAALAMLKEAHRSAPETVAYNGYAKRIVLEEANSSLTNRRRQASDLAVTLGFLSA